MLHPCRRNSVSTSPPSTLMERILEEAWMHERNAECEANCSNRMNDAPISTWKVHHSSRQQTSNYLESWYFDLIVTYYLSSMR